MARLTTSPRPIADCPARFGAGLVGGAEIVLAQIGLGLAARGWEVEVLTTAKDHFTWANKYESGVAEKDGLVVRRFPALYHHLLDTAETYLSVHHALPRPGGRVGW